MNQFSNKVEIIDYHEDSGHLRGHYLDLVASKSYTYGGHYIPHDGKRSDTFTGDGMAETARKQYGIEMRYVRKAESVSNEIETTRRDMSHWSIDQNKCGQLFEHLTKYHENETTGKPCHRNNCSICKGASHGADTARMLAVARDLKIVEPYLQGSVRVRNRQQYAEQAWVVA